MVLYFFVHVNFFLLIYCHYFSNCVIENSEGNKGVAEIITIMPLLDSRLHALWRSSLLLNGSCLIFAFAGNVLEKCCFHQKRS